MCAAFEGVAFSLRAGLDTLKAAGRTPATLRFAGGGSSQPWWRKLLCDVLGMPVHGVAIADASVRGAALLAGLGMGHWSTDDLESLLPSAVALDAPEADVRIEQRYGRFLELSGRHRNPSP